MSEDILQLLCMPFVCLHSYVCAWWKEGERWKKKEGGGGVLMIIWEGVCATEFAPTWIAHSQHASSNHFNSFTSTNLMAQSRASEVFIPNPVHNLMAFESLPLPPGWQVVHLDLIESIYILHKWKAHGGLPTWFWSATELGEPRSSEYAWCQQGIHYTVKWEREEERTPFDITLGSNLIQFEFSYLFTFPFIPICLAGCGLFPVV